MNAIIIIALGLIVMGVIVYLLITNASGTSEDIKSCKAKGGVCRDKCLDGEVGSTFFTGDPNCKGKICCRKPFGD